MDILEYERRLEELEKRYEKSLDMYSMVLKEISLKESKL